MKTASRPESSPGQPEPDEAGAGYVVDFPEPSSDEVLAGYRTYREIGGAPFEPYETQLEEQLTTELQSGHPKAGEAQAQLMRLTHQES